MGQNKITLKIIIYIYKNYFSIYIVMGKLLLLDPKPGDLS